MVSWNWLEKLFDKYSLTARLYPALLTAAPIIWSAIALFPDVTNSIVHASVFTLVAGCLLYFLTSVARSKGKFAEAKLIAKWGAWPTTLLLRHRDQTVDKITKARHHKTLSSLCGGLHFPSEVEEDQSPEQADEVYRSATKRLLEQRRGAQYGMIHAENASYGFRRNLFGLKPAAIVISMVVSILTTIGWFLVTPAPYTFHLIIQASLAYPHLPLLVLVDVGYVALWVWVVRESFVFQAGKEYAIALLRTLDQQSETKTRKKPAS